jgi:hypothetical protein
MTHQFHDHFQNDGLIICIIVKLYYDGSSSLEGDNTCCSCCNSGKVVMVYSYNYD